MAALDRFSERGIVERIPSEVDRRSHTNPLTPAGMELADRLVTAIVRARQTMFEDLSSDQIATLTKILATIIATIDPHD